MSNDEIRPTETIAYQEWRRYRDGWFSSSNIAAIMTEARNFVAGRQYRDPKMDDGTPKPIVNITREYVEKVFNKLMETKTSVQFVADSEKINLGDLETFYDYQMKVIRNRKYMGRALRDAIIDGTGCAITSFDADTIGTESLFRGFLARKNVQFEDLFFENPYTEDEQDQEYLGYCFQMSVGAARRLVEASSDAERARKEALIVPDAYYDNETRPDYDPSALDNEQVTLYYRFFRVDGEVCFTLSTRYCELFEYPHALNPRLNKLAVKLQKAYDKKVKKEGARGDDAKNICDYDIDPGRYVLFEQAVKESHKRHRKEKGKFYRYPISLIKVYPIPGRINGESGVSQIIANQKLINLVALYIILILQYHAMPKWVAKKEALNGQTPDNTPNQVIYDYSPITATQPGITRLSAGDAVNSNLIAVLDNLIDKTRSTNGFTDIVAGSTSEDSGYALEQKIHQVNLVLEQPQERYWEFLEEIAKTDIMYFKHYVDNAKFYVRNSQSEVELQDRYRSMSQDLINAGQVSAPVVDGREVRRLPNAKSVVVMDASADMFDADFDVTIEVQQGIATSEISEAQHYEKIYQYIFSEAADAGKIRAFIQNDPMFSLRTKQRVVAALDALEVDELRQKDAEIAKLKELINNLMGTMEQASRNMDYLKARDQARDRAMADANKANLAAVRSFADAATTTGDGVKSESEVKSQNAKGVSGGHFQ